MESQNNDTNEMKNKSFRLSEEVTRRIRDLLLERQVTTDLASIKTRARGDYLEVGERSARRACPN
ncbi:hypothetical protein [Exiguobacterium sp. ERU656]|uniref:hypothetical protein n=1 Tax=Exiguobacterium sp. ERU656 TaxID=2751217 RepID=UPI001BE8AD73|nr:hypothetical protein [Exiguobacterium sp. ERU656]